MTHDPTPQDPLAGAEALTVDAIDKAALNQLTTAALEPRTYYGKNLALSEHDRAQLGLVTGLADKILEPMFADPAWTEFQTLVQEGRAKGVLTAGDVHKDTNVPLWCIGGGPSATVRKVKRTTAQGYEANGIEVPDSVFNLFHWQRTVNAVNEIARISDETLRGRSTNPLGLDLQRLAFLIKNSSEPQE
ncbi:MAG: hypothetical protein JWO47_868 [Candidatus Saccharibacteria bacterium]|nr:hypothetical protein [Candidatus Saccharibacteria bacterium]